MTERKVKNRKVDHVDQSTCYIMPQFGYILVTFPLKIHVTDLIYIYYKNVLKTQRFIVHNAYYILQILTERLENLLYASEIKCF